MEIDRADVVAEVLAAFLDYERALVQQRHDQLDEYFWQHDRVVRFGIAEIQYGPEAIARWRRVSPHVGDDRTLRNTTVTAFGADLATVATEFYRPDSPLVGRQSQVWARLDGRWTVVHAHVSLLHENEVDRSGRPATEQSDQSASVQVPDLQP